MSNVQHLIDVINKMTHSRVHNYVIPGLTSSLVGGDGHGTVRLFDQNRHHEEPITPHSHRFDFACLVLRGRVKNVIWNVDEAGDTYAETYLYHHGKFGKYDVAPQKSNVYYNWIRTETEYREGDLYHMKAHEVHSIFFSTGAKVLFFEGPNYLEESFVLEPVVNGKIIPTFRVESWMFEKEA